jgi:hypothetical protein
MHDDLGPTFVTVVEVFVGVGCLLGIGLVVVDQVHKSAVVRVHVALTARHLLALEPELAEIEGDLTYLGQFVHTNTWNRGAALLCRVASRPHRSS